MQEVRRKGSSSKPAKLMEVSSGHKRSKSFPDKIAKEDSLDNYSSGVSCRSKLDMGQMKDQVELKMKLYPKTELQSSLKKEIVHLEKRLDDQFVVRRTLERALGCRSSFRDTCNENSMSKPANELIKEIAVLELEVVYLEQYLLSLYRRAFNQRISSVSPPSTTNEREKSPPIVEKEMCIEISGQDIKSNREPPEFQFSQPLVPEDSFACSPKEMQITNVRDQLLDSGIHRCHSELSQRSAFPTRTTTENLDRAIRSCHSQPLSYMESTTPYVISLAEHLGTRIADHVPQTPNKISEDMIKCMSAIYCKLSDPPLMNHSFSFSPNSSFSSVSELSPPNQFDIWSPWYRKESSFDARLVNPFHVESFREFSGPYSTMVEVPSICKDSQRLNSIDPMLQNYRSLISLLEEIDPRRMKHEERLAFWINIHNALVMHTFLAYGIPQNNLKRVSLFLKAAYNVGGHTISAETIQSSILGCRMSRPGQWLRLLFSPRTKFKARDDRQSYAIEHPEPLLHFALCSGSHSDPAVRVYTPKRVIQELDTAREEYIRATLSVRKEQKLLLPKIIESFAKESGLCHVGLVEMIRNFVPETLWKTMQQGSQQWKSHKSIEWVPHNFAFRYLFSKELVK